MPKSPLVQLTVFKSCIIPALDVCYQNVTIDLVLNVLVS